MKKRLEIHIFLYSRVILMLVISLDIEKFKLLLDVLFVWMSQDAYSFTEPAAYHRPLCLSLDRNGQMFLTLDHIRTALYCL